MLKLQVQSNLFFWKNNLHFSQAISGFVHAYAILVSIAECNAGLVQWQSRRAVIFSAGSRGGAPYFVKKEMTEGRKARRGVKQNRGPS